ncbi:MAG: EAL domain-containing protein [Betaproteobacteria bacterium]|nr:MAG: EAL domain-containing protein [Betaproteobacteria bacterium]
MFEDVMPPTSVASAGERHDATENAALSYDALATIVDASGDAIISESLDGEILIWSAGAERMLGFTAAEAIGERADRLLREESILPRADVATKFASGDTIAPFESVFHRKDGEGVPVSVTVKGLYDASGALVGVTRIARDVGERKAAQARIGRMNRGYAILRAINAAIVRIRDRSELLEEACRVAVAQGGFRMAWVGSIGTAREDPVVVLAHAGDERGFLSRVRFLLDRNAPGGRNVAVAAIIDNRTAVDNDIESNHAPGDIRDEHLARGYRAAAALPLRLDGKPIGALVLYASRPGFFTPDEIKLLEEFAADVALGMAFVDKSKQAEYLAYNDPLTGLPNRVRFLERIAMHAGGTASGAEFGVMLLDLDRFRSINDTHGPAAGDEALRTVAKRLRAAAPGAEPPARIGADAFGLLLNGLRDGAQAAQTVERILTQTFNAPIRFEGVTFRLSAKAGIALHPAHGRDAGTLFRNAEAAREIATASPEPFLIYARDMHAELSLWLATENRLRYGVEEKQFVVHYQPKVDAATRTMVGAEALLRWNDPENGLVSTQQFVALLEETGLIVDTGRFVLLRVLEDIARWRSKGLAPPRIAVNVSAVQLRRGGFFSELSDVVGAAGGHAAGVDVEITESALLSDVADTIDKLKEIRKLGVEIAIDDFGTGYSSLNYLARLPVSTLKIDRSFLQDLPGNAEGLTIVSSIISLAHALKFKVVAEGVETEEQARLLRGLSCDEMQGFLFHGVLTSDRFEALLPRA